MEANIQIEASDISENFFKDLLEKEIPFKLNFPGDKLTEEQILAKWVDIIGNHLTILIKNFEEIVDKYLLSKKIDPTGFVDNLREIEDDFDDDYLPKEMEERFEFDAVNIFFGHYWTMVMINEMKIEGKVGLVELFLNRVVESIIFLFSELDNNIKRSLLLDIVTFD
jgi:hypothetical protein